MVTLIYQHLTLWEKVFFFGRTSWDICTVLQQYPETAQSHFSSLPGQKLLTQRYLVAVARCQQINS